MEMAKPPNGSSMVFVVGSSERIATLYYRTSFPSGFLFLFFMSLPFVADTVEAIHSRSRCSRRPCEVTV